MLNFQRVLRFCLVYRIEKKPYGIKFTFDGFVPPEEMSEYKKEFRLVLDLVPAQFGILSDLRNMKPLPPESQKILSANPEWTAGRITRSATILNSSLVKLQSKRLATEWKQGDTKRYIDASKHSNWEELAIAWIEKGEEIE